jgi:hypothetical protein
MGSRARHFFRPAKRLLERMNEPAPRFPSAVSFVKQFRLGVRKRLTGFGRALVCASNESR